MLTVEESSMVCDLSVTLFFFFFVLKAREYIILSAFVRQRHVLMKTFQSFRSLALVPCCLLSLLQGCPQMSLHLVSTGVYATYWRLVCITSCSYYC